MPSNPPKLVIPTVVAKADSGASKHYFRPQDINVLDNIIDEDGPTVALPDNTTLHATKAGTLPITGVSTLAKKVHIIPKLSSSSLISMGQLCDDDCDVHLRKEDMDVKKDNKVIIRGLRNKFDGLWDIEFKNPITTRNKLIKLWDINSQKVPTKLANLNLQTPVTYKAHLVVQQQSIPELIAFYKGCAFSPVKSTWIQAIKNENFITWPGLTAERVAKYYPVTTATPKGHLDQEQQNIQSTKPHEIPLSPEETEEMQQDFFPTRTPTPTNNVMCTIVPFNTPSKAYADLTGKFPYRSSSGNQYIMIFYNYDANYINAIPVKSRRAADLKNAFILHTEELMQSGIKPLIYILDNEISNELKAALKKYKIAYQLVPPAQHRRNAAERAIRTFKNHFLAGLASLPQAFPISEWDRLIAQALLTLNLLRNSRLNPKLSAHAMVKGNHDFNSHPLAPPGSQVVAHEKSTHRKSWDLHGKDGWYVGPSTEHYRCVRIFIPETGDERICDTVQFIPTAIAFPKTTTADYLLQAADDIVALLKTKTGIDLPNHPNPKLSDAIKATAELLQRAAVKPPTITPTPKNHDNQLNPSLPQPSNNKH